jgi:hypothetical protein
MSRPLASELAAAELETRYPKLETRSPKLETTLSHHGGVFGFDFVEDSYFAGLAIGIFVDA